MKKRKITSIKEISPSIFLISLKRDFDFIPGQVIGLSMNLFTPPRLYSIASSDKSDEVWILFDEKEKGVLTPWLAARKVGDEIYTTGVSGNFYSEKNEKAYWIASGTGIAPFASMFFSGYGGNKILIHGGRKINSFYFSNEFLAGMNDKYIRCCSQESGPGIFHGRLTQYLKERKSFPKDYKYYLCGSAEMVVETRDILLSGGVEYENIIAEIYF